MAESATVNAMNGAYSGHLALAITACLEHNGTACVVCGFDFEKMYGPVAKDFIHVHHLYPLHFLGGEVEVDPI